MSPEASAVFDIEENTNSNPNEVEKGSRIAEFRAFVSENSGVLVESDRAPGFKAPFGVLMNMCAAEITGENVEMFFGEAKAMLARAEAETPEEETEEVEDENLSQDEDTANTETDKDKTAGKNESDKPKLESENDKPAEPENKNAPLRPAQSHSKVERPRTIVTSQKKEAVDTTRPNIDTVDIPHKLGDRPVTVADAVELKPETEVKVTKEKSDDKVPDVMIVREHTTDGSEIIKQSPEPIHLSDRPALAEVLRGKIPSESEQTVLIVDEEYKIQTPEPEPDDDILPVDIETAEVSGYEVIETIQLAEDEERAWQTPADLIELKMLQLKASSEVIPSKDEPNQEIHLYEHQPESHDILPELSVPIEEVEETIVLVTERLEEMEPDETEYAYQILDEIFQKVAEVNISVERELDKQEQGILPEFGEVEQELSELFIRLFDYLEIDYTPELISSCAKLVLMGNIPETTAKVKQEEANVSHDSGTHEVIKQLLTAASNIKQSVGDAYRIGKSVLQLYFQQLVPADN